MATLSLPPLLEPFYNIENPQPTLDHEPLQFGNKPFNNDTFNNILSQFPHLDEHKSYADKSDDANQPHDNEAIPPPIDNKPDNTTTDDHIKCHKTTTINSNWCPGLQAMHRANNKKAEATNNRKKAQHERHSAPTKPVPKCPYKLLDVRDNIESLVL